jgi:hypothetical protein
MDNTGWLFGLEKFFEFKNLHEHKAFIRAFINLLYAEEKDRPWALKTCISLDYESFPAKDRELRINLYTDVMTRQTFSQRTLFWLFYNIWGDEFTNKLYLFFNNTDAEVANDLFSKSQVQSKIWMTETLNKFQQKFGNILLLGGWYGQHHWYLDKFKYDKLYNVDLDSDVLEKSKNIIAAGDRYATAAADVNDVVKDTGQIVFNNQNLEIDLVINTSSEHMSTVWFDRLPLGQLVLLQSNDMLGMEGHVNCVESQVELHQRYRLREVLFSGELTLSKGKRFMLYGIK